jgi:hypothetical protein
LPGKPSTFHPSPSEQKVPRFPGVSMVGSPRP